MTESMGKVQFQRPKFWVNISFIAVSYFSCSFLPIHSLLKFISVFFGASVVVQMNNNHIRIVICPSEISPIDVGGNEALTEPSLACFSLNRGRET